MDGAEHRGSLIGCDQEGKLYTLANNYRQAKSWAFIIRVIELKFS